ncbi:MAG TPA: DNA repair protein RadC [Candidatus Limiplasma sp.]|nr:DNA repair protein RadC [Candidatus Limiplasma sp.]
MEHSGHRQRMRERYVKQGLDGFAQHEVLELLLFYAIPQKNVNPIAHALIDRFGSLYGVLNATQKQLTQVEGIGEYAATYLSLFLPAARHAEAGRSASRIKLGTRRAAVDYCIRLLDGEKREMFYALCLNGQMETIGDVLIAKGSLSDVPAYPRVVMDAVLTHNAHGVIFCHNHPGGTISPSQADLDATATLSRLLAEVEVTLIDHIIVAEQDALSMVRNGFIEQQVTQTGVIAHVANSDGEMRLAHRLKIDHLSATEDA